MSYKTDYVLEQLWNSFEEKIKTILNLPLHIADIKKLMTAESVIDLSMHEIYFHTEYVHELTETLVNLRNAKPENNEVNECCSLWLNILKQRNQSPLKIMHHKKLDGECDFRFSLQLMEDRPHGFKEIQVLDPKDKAEVKEVIKSIHRLECLAEGMSFAKLPLVNDIVLSAILEYNNVICLIAKDQENQIVGYCWGMYLKDVTVGKGQKANIFWVMDLARDPDFFDAAVKVGDQLRLKMLDLLRSRNDCDFVGYQHLVNHKFHMDIISNAKDGDELIRLNDSEFAAKTSVKYDDTLGAFMRFHIIRTSENNIPYPDPKSIKPAVFKALRLAAHSAKDFILGGMAFFGQIQYQRLTHPVLGEPMDSRLAEHISNEQRECDIDILKEIILSDKWLQQGKSIFSSKHVPSTIQKLQTCVKEEAFNFEAIRSYVAARGNNLLRGDLTKLFYNVIADAHSPTFVLNSLLTKKETPKDWLELINDKRKLALNKPSNNKAV